MSNGSIAVCFFGTALGWAALFYGVLDYLTG